MIDTSREVLEPPAPPTDQQSLDKAFPMLQELHENERIIVAHLPEDAQIFPNAQISVLPYYMNRFDSPEEGLWKISVKDTLTARIQSIPAKDSAIFYKITVAPEGGEIHDADEDEFHQVASLLSHLHEIYLKEDKTPEEENNLFRRIGSTLIKFFKN